jgi:hypothetical protein
VARLLPVRDVVTHAACNPIQACNERRQPTPASLATSDLHTPISPMPPCPSPSPSCWVGRPEPGPSLGLARPISQNPQCPPK